MERRTFSGLILAAIGGIFVPKYGSWFKQGSGVWVPPENWIFATQRAGPWFSRGVWKGGRIPEGIGDRINLNHILTVSEDKRLHLRYASIQRLPMAGIEQFYPPSGQGSRHRIDDSLIYGVDGHATTIKPWIPEVDNYYGFE